MINRISKKGWPERLVVAIAIPGLMALAGCNSSSDDSSGSAEATGVFGGVPVAGLDYTGTETPAGRTDELGRFQYREGERLTFALGELVLGSADGAGLITARAVTEGAPEPVDPAVSNRLILLQSLDEDGDLNNGIQISDAIRAGISENAGLINFDQSVADFRASLAPILDELESAGAFTDLDPRPRTARSAAAAIDLFTRATSPRTRVATSGGELSGFEANEGTWQFLGIPYAQPPVGDLRWRPPVAPAPWSGVRHAVEWMNQSAQDPTLEPVNEGGMSEDSLYLHVTAPKDAQDLPVMVWFHGGSFSILSANSKQYNNPAGLTDKGVVLVTVNHRLGPFGYIAHPLLTEESGYDGSGNYGQMDLVMALEWVRDNISEFGGDPGNVTIFGQSGGGGKAYSLMNSPQATGLFHKAIIMAGFAPLDTESEPADTLAVSEAIGQALFERAGVTTLEEARALPWTAITQADLDNNIPRQVYRPNADNYYQPDTYYQNVVDGMPSDVPLMAGVTSGDYDTLRAALPIWLNQRTPSYQSDQFIYHFSRVPPGWAEMGLKSCHGCELPYLFNYPAGMVQNYMLGLVLTDEGTRPEIGDLNGNGVSGSDGDAVDVFASMQYGADDVALADLTMTLFTNFARDGVPDTGSIHWPAWTQANDTFVEIGPGTEATVRSGLEEAME